MKTALTGVKGLPSSSTRVGRSSPPRRYSSVLFPDPLAPTMETYSPRRMSRLTPLRIIVRASPVPSARCTFWARRSSPRTCVRGCESEGDSVSTTNDLHGVVFRGAPRGIHRRDQHDDHRCEKRGNVIPSVIAHQQPFGFHQPFDLDR